MGHGSERRLAALDWILFASTLLIFLVTRLYGLERFPIYFFTDEAVQAVSAADFVNHGWRNSLGELLPTYFPNGPYLNLSVSVYAQIIPYLLFGFSEFATRATSVLVALSGTAAVGLILKDAFRVRFWWLGTLLLAATPAWFLHSRTAFETVLATSFYAWFLFFYLRVRTSAPWNIYPALLFAALAFYSYSPMQLVVGATLVLVVLSDLRFYRRTPRTALGGLALLALLAIPYVRFYAAHAADASDHLRTLGSYWTTRTSLGDKVHRFLHEYAYGLSPRFWYAGDNHRDLDRHQMKGYGNILAVTFPFAVLGLLVCLKNVRSPAPRALLLATLACPLGGAIVATAITRDLVFVVPAALLTTIGAATLLTRLVGRVRYAYLAPALFVVLAAANVAMLRDALANGPTWYTNYGLYGLQYGGPQVTAAVREHVERTPGDRILVSPTWANGTDVVFRFFLPDEERVQLGSIVRFQFDRLPFDEHLLFVMTPEEYAQVRIDPKFSDVRLEKTLPYPDGRPGFYFVRLRYSSLAEAIFATERRERARPVRETISLLGDRVRVTHSRFDIGRIQDLFDDDSFTLARTLEANPAVIRLAFAHSRTVSGIEVATGVVRPRVRVSVVRVGSTTTTVFTAGPRRTGDTTVSLTFGRPLRARVIEIRTSDPDDVVDPHVHLREIRLR
jgi:4-amino-4-deoxy-L-arabinose transferase-like glycosyltransferase